MLSLPPESHGSEEGDESSISLEVTSTRESPGVIPEWSHCKTSKCVAISVEIFSRISSTHKSPTISYCNRLKKLNRSSFTFGAHNKT